MSPGFLSYTLWGRRRGTCKGVEPKSMVLRPLIPKQSANTPRTPIREAPQIHHWGPLLLSVTSHLQEHSPEIRKFFRSTAGISLPSVALMTVVLMARHYSWGYVRWRLDPSHFLWPLLEGPFAYFGCSMELARPSECSSTLHLMHMQAQGIGFLTAERGRELLLKKSWLSD